MGLRKRNLTVSGKKQALIDRLIEFEQKNKNDDTGDCLAAMYADTFEAQKEENQMTEVDKHKMQKYLNIVMDDSKMSNEALESRSNISEIMDVFQINSKSKYLSFIEQKCNFWKNELDEILIVNFGKKDNENANAYYLRICDQMETAIESANSLLESKKLSLQRCKEHLLVFFAHFIAFSSVMYIFMKYLFENAPKPQGWTNYTSYDYEMRKIRWCLKQKSITKKHARLMRFGLEKIWTAFDLQYGGNTFHGQQKDKIINDLFRRWQ